MIELKSPTAPADSIPTRPRAATSPPPSRPSLAKRAALVEINGKQWDLDRPLDGGGDFKLIMRDDPDALETIRHDAAHILAQAVQELFPGTQVTIGPAIEDGFYYDFFRAEPFSTDDFAAIEKRMAEIVDRDEKLVREVWNRDEAIAMFEAKGETFQGRADPRPAGGRDDHRLPDGRHWKPTCAAARTSPSTKFGGQGLQPDQAGRRLLARRPPQSAAAAHLRHGLGQPGRPGRLPAARRGGREAGITASWAARWSSSTCRKRAGAWCSGTPRGWILWQVIEAYMRRRLTAAGYVEVKTPQVLDRKFWEASGHWDKYRPNMFVCETVEGETLSLKPMNCPGHVQIFERRPALVPRAAAAHGRVRRLPPLRAVGRPARPDARARLHPGRRPHLLPRGPDRRRDAPVHRT